MEIMRQMIFEMLLSHPHYQPKKSWSVPNQVIGQDRGEGMGEVGRWKRGHGRGQQG